MERRRLLENLLSGLFLALTAGASRAFSPDPGKADWDLLIAGAGAAGLAAACAARELGVERVAVLESEPVAGGSSLVSGGFWAVSCTELQKSLGIEDSDEAFFDDILSVGNHENDPEVVRAFIGRNRVQYEWVRSLGVEPTGIASGAGITRAHVFRPERLVGALLGRAKRLGVEVFVGTSVRRLILEEGRVCGLTAVRAGKTLRLRSKRGVLLATGGFSRNRGLLEACVPKMRFVSTLAAQGARGDGLIMAQDVGAALADVGSLEASYAFTLHPSTIADMSLLPYLGALIVNREGRRFVDEALPYKRIAREVLRQPNAQSFIVFDERIRELALDQPLDRVLWLPLSRGEVPDYVCRGKTIEEAAEACGIDQVALAGEVTRFNASISGGMSPLRGPASVGGGVLKPIERAPFFIMPASVCLLGTYGGVKINAEARVVGTDGKIIPGLWAAGEVTGGFHGASFIMGTAFGKALTFGRIAAESIAREGRRP